MYHHARRTYSLSVRAEGRTAEAVYAVGFGK
jgi:hypothetical protein